MSIGIGLCVNQTRAVLEALMGRETEFVRTPKHGIRGKLESWSGKKYRSAKSVTPFIELAMAAYFVVAIGVAIDHGHYISMPVPLPVPLRLRLRRLGLGLAGQRRRRAARPVRPPRRHRGRRRRLSGRRLRPRPTPSPRRDRRRRRERLALTEQRSQHPDAGLGPAGPGGVRERHPRRAS